MSYIARVCYENTRAKYKIQFYSIITPHAGQTPSAPIALNATYDVFSSTCFFTHSINASFAMEI
jgi:hypothetical protein